MFLFFDYIFYRVCKAYSRTKDSSPEVSAFCLVALMQFFNILSILMVFAIIIKDKSFFSKIFGGCIVIVLMILSYIRYVYKENKNYKILSEKWRNESKSRKKGMIVLIYIILSVIINFGLAIFLGNKDW